MAYTNQEYEATVSGVVLSEVWVNRWCFLVTGGSGQVATIVDAMRAFYNGVNDFLSDTWSADAIAVKNLGTNVVSNPSWESIVGASSSAALPGQVAIRVSLDDLLGHRGGPFIAGTCAQNLDTVGQIASGTVNGFATALDELASSNMSNGASLRINRTSVGSTVAALRGRIGSRFDVIRKRNNDVPESYTAVDLT